MLLRVEAVLQRDAQSLRPDGLAPVKEAVDHVPPIRRVEPPMSRVIGQSANVPDGNLRAVMDIGPVRPRAVGAVAGAVKERRELVVPAVRRQPGRGQRIVLTAEPYGLRDRRPAVAAWQGRVLSAVLRRRGASPVRDMLAERDQCGNGQCEQDYIFQNNSRLLVPGEERTWPCLTRGDLLWQRAAEKALLFLQNTGTGSI